LKRAIFTILLSLSLITSTTWAWDWSLPFNGNAIFKKANDETLTASGLVEDIDDGIGDGLVSILALLKNVGLAIGVCALTYMAVQIILSPPERKAQLKEGATPYFLGLLLLIAGVPIAITIINIFIGVF